MTTAENRMKELEEQFEELAGKVEESAKNNPFNAKNSTESILWRILHITFYIVIIITGILGFNIIADFILNLFVSNNFANNNDIAFWKTFVNYILIIILTIIFVHILPFNNKTKKI